LKQQLKEQRQASAKLFKGTFGAPPAPRTPAQQRQQQRSDQDAAAGARRDPAAAAATGLPGAPRLLASLWQAVAGLLGWLLRVVRWHPVKVKAQ